MKKILITGYHGFTARYVASEFRQHGYQVIGLVHRNAKADEIECDLTDAVAVQEMIEQLRPDGVIHLAGLSFVAHTDQAALYQVNIFTALNLLHALENCGIQAHKLIFASSANVYGNNPSAMIDESALPAPVDHYGNSKLAMEFMIKNWFDKFPIIITRSFNYIGIGQSGNFLIPKIITHYQQRKSQIQLGNLDIARDFSDVRDFARAYFQLYESAARSEIVNLSSATIHSLEEIIQLMDKIAGYSIEVLVNPDFVRNNEIKVLCGNNKKLKKLTNYQAKFSFEQTLNNMYHSK